MDTFKRTPLELFSLPQHFLVPLFQRPYVWRQEEQWEPLWKDICRVVDVRMNSPHLSAKHFLGAVVLQAHEASLVRLNTWNVIDGQQRLTTLQLLADAAAAVFAEAGLARLSSQLEGLTHNPAAFVLEGDGSLKLRHLNSDREAFEEVMSAEAPVDHTSLKHAESRLVQAHSYFTVVLRQWLGAPGAGQFELRAEHLTQVLLSDLQLVTIQLTATENSQEIFETLNARGTPLTAADLVRNFVFQRLEAEGADVKKAYREHWPFEARFWTKEVSVGRYFVSRSSLFLNQWLMARLGEEIGPQSTFTAFKAYIEHRPQVRMVDLLPVLQQQAHQYEAWTVAASRPSGTLDVVERNVYRMQATSTEVLKPLLLWLHEPGRGVPADVIKRVVTAAESWVLRRQLLRLPGSDLGRIVADVIRSHSGAPTDELADRVIAHLSRLNVSSTYWPGDAEVRSALLTEPVFRRFPRARTRAILEAIEDDLRSETKQSQVERAGFPIEHVLPRAWHDHWPVETPQQADDRQAHVHRLGNLTLLTTSLNSKVSNGPWLAKRKAFLQHSTINMTGRLVERTESVPWSEELIDARTEEMIDAILRIWPVPTGHTGEVVDPQAKTGDWVGLKHLLGAKLLSAGEVIVAGTGDQAHREAVITPDGLLSIDGRVFDTPSGAAKHVRGVATNGWSFWRLPDGRRLRDVRAAFSAGDVGVSTTEESRA